MWLLIILVLSLLPQTAHGQAPPASQCVTTAVAGGTGDAITIPRLPCVPTTTLLLLTITNANTTTTPTITGPGLARMPLVGATGAALAAGALEPGFHAMLSSNGQKWYLLNTQVASAITGSVTANNTAAVAALDPGSAQSVTRLGFAAPGDAPPLLYTWAASCPGTPDNGAFITSTVVSGGCWVAQFPTDGADVREWGADATGIADAAPPFNAAFNAICTTANKLPATLVIAAGSYLFKTTLPAPVPAIDPAAVVVSGCQRGALSIEASPNANFAVADAIAFSVMFVFNTPSGSPPLSVYWRGGSFTGNHTGVSAGNESAGFGLFSLNGFSFRDMRFPGNWGGLSSPFVGDWLANGIFDNMYMPVVGQCYDVAFLRNVTISHTYAVGADANGNSGGTDQVGNKCISIIYDTNFVGLNNTGVNFSNTNGVNIEGNSAENFIFGWLIGSGNQYSFSGNVWRNNVGSASASQPGYGGGIIYFNSGPFTSVGNPPGNITIGNDVYVNNGNPTIGGAAIIMGVAAISNSDQIKNVSLMGTILRNGITVGFEANAAPGTKIENVMLQPVCEGANSCIGGNIVQAMGNLSSGNVSSYNGQSGVMLIGPHVTGNELVPTVSSCGTSPSIVGSDLVGQITVGSGGATSCVLTFNSPYSSGPRCTANSALDVPIGITGGGASITFTAPSSMSGAAIFYHCMQ